jgi:peptide deformylase
MNSDISLQIHSIGDPIFKIRSVEVNVNDIIEFGSLAQQMYKNMKLKEISHISAVHFGYNVRLIILEIEKDSRKFPVYMINPKIIQQSFTDQEEFIFLKESCCSAPDLELSLQRVKNIEVQYTDLQGSIIKSKFDENISRFILHEIDHLDGKIFFDLIQNEEEKEEIYKRFFKTEKIKITEKDNIN